MPIPSFLFPDVPLAEIAWRSAIPESWRDAAVPASLRAPAIPESPRDDAIPESPRDTAIALAGRSADLASAASTSGWAYKYPGRVGDSALPGCGHYADARWGGAACTHTGEMAIRAGTARSVVLHLAHGLSLDAACRAAIMDLRRLEGGFLDELVIHAVDAGGNHCVATTGIAAAYWWWREGMREPVRLLAVAM